MLPSQGPKLEENCPIWLFGHWKIAGSRIHQHPLIFGDFFLRRRGRFDCQVVLFDMGLFVHRVFRCRDFQWTVDHPRSYLSMYQSLFRGVVETCIETINQPLIDLCEASKLAPACHWEFLQQIAVNIPKSLVISHGNDWLVVWNNCCFSIYWE